LTLALIFVRVASLFIIWVKSVQRHRFYSRGQGQRSKVSCHQNLITFRFIRTHSYQVTSICDK